MLQPGAEVGDYRVEAHVATGAMGEVYRVRHRSRGTVHALKYLPLASSRVRKRLLREAESQTRLSHPNVVTLTEALDFGGDPALIMEFVDGPSLSAWLEGRTLELREAESLFVGIVSGVAHAHRRGLVHRDLKPSNVLLARTPAGLVPKVADFGIVKAMDEEEGGERLTFTGSSLGSPAYMAPEQIKDAHEVDQRADVFSLGCLFYEMICGCRAFEGRDMLDVLNAVSEGDYEPPQNVVSDLPDRIVQVITCAMARDRDDRFADCDQMLDVLLAGEEITAIRPEVPPSEETTDVRPGFDSEAQTAVRPAPGGSEEETAVRPAPGRAVAGGEEETAVRPIPGASETPTATPAPPRSDREDGWPGVFVALLVLALALVVGMLGAWLVLG